MVNAQPGICPRKWSAQTPLWFQDTNGSPNLGQTTRSNSNQQKNRELAESWTLLSRRTTEWNQNNAKLKEYEKRDKNRDFARELKNLRNIKVTIIPIVIGAFRTVTKGLVQGLEDLEITGRLETILITALLRSARILRRVLETWVNLLSLKLQWETFVGYLVPKPLS